MEDIFDFEYRVILLNFIEACIYNCIVIHNMFIMFLFLIFFYTFSVKRHKNVSFLRKSKTI